MAEHWANLNEQEQARISALPFEAACHALLDHAPHASAADLAALAWDPPHSAKEFKQARASWKAARALGQTAEDAETALDAIPVRDRLITQLHDALTMRNTVEANRLIDMLGKVDGAGRTTVENPSTEDWTRLTDSETGILIALVHKLNGEQLTDADTQWLSLLPP